MRIVLMTLIVLFLGSCASSDSKTDYNELIQNGEWKLISTKERTKKYKYGMKFSEDKQVFFLDSQGHAIPPHHILLYEINQDTLTLIDHKFEDRFLHSKGTTILIIQKLTKHKMILESIHPEINTLTFEKDD